MSRKRIVEAVTRRRLAEAMTQKRLAEAVGSNAMSNGLTNKMIWHPPTIQTNQITDIVI